MKFKYLSVFIVCALLSSTMATLAVSIPQDPEPTAAPTEGEIMDITGWPKNLPGYCRSTAICMDIDEDGYNEIIQSSYGHYTHIWNENATNVPGWPNPILGDPSCSSSAIGDVDGDGDYEIVTTTWSGGDTYVWHWQDGQLLAGSWPKHFGYAIRANPVIADLDGDGDGEIIVTAMDPDNIYDGIHVYQHDGSLMWETFLENMQGPIAVADLDDDGELEVVASSWTDTYVLNSTGVVKDQISGGSHKSVVIGDLDNNGVLEIVGCTSSSVRAMQYDGSQFIGFWETPETSFGGYGTMSLGDLDGDGTLEVFVLKGQDGRLHGYDSDGTPLSALGFPKDTVSGAPSASDPQSAATVGDIDGDGDHEILIGSTNGNVLAWEHTGDVAAGFPLSTPGEVITTATLADLDKDGDIEMMLGVNKINTTKSDFRVWDLAGAYDPDNIEWGMFRHDAQCSGLAWRTPTLDPITLPEFVEVGEEVQFELTAHNPDNLTLHYYVRQMPAGASFNESSHVFTWTPSVGQLGDTYKMYPFLTDSMRQDHIPWTTTVVNSTKFHIPVTDGWNFISFPIDVSGNVSTILDDSINGDGLTTWDVVQWYDAQTQEWKSYSTFKPPSLNNMPEVNNTMGFWIHVISSIGDENLTVGSGVCPSSTSMTLYAGWNMVGYPALTEKSITDALVGTGYDAVEGFNATAPYRLVPIADIYMMKAGEAYWIHVPADTTWVIDW